MSTRTVRRPVQLGSVPAPTPSPGLMSGGEETLFDPWSSETPPAAGGSSSSTSTSNSTATSASASASASSSKAPSRPPLGSRTSLRRRQRTYSSDLLGSFEDEDHVGPLHPLEGEAGAAGQGTSAGDSRPTLKRLTSETERLAEIASGGSRSGSEVGSMRGSFDLLRMTPNDVSPAGEVEVLVHQVKPNESLAGIALLYGIDVATLRKTNKLWPTDPVHIRTCLYVPLDACRWNKASETFIRGPGEGQVTLVPKQPHQRRASADYKGKGKAKPEDSPASTIRPLNGHIEHPRDTSPFGDWQDVNEYGEWQAAGPSLPSPRRQTQSTPAATPLEQSSSQDTVHEPNATDTVDDLTPRVLDVVRLPSSQLRFFPKGQTPSSSHERHHSRAASMSTRSEGPSIHSDMHTLPRPLRPKPPPQPPKSNMVRLRPPSNSTYTPTSSSGIVGRISSFFDIPPPPSHMQPYGSAKAGQVSRPRLSLESTFSSPRTSRRSSTTSSPARTQPEVLLELHPRGKPSVETFETIRPPTRRPDKKLD